MRPEDSTPKPSGSASPAGRVAGRGLGVWPQLVTAPVAAFERLRADPQWLGSCLLIIVLIASATWIRLPQDLAFAEEGMVAGMERFGLSDADIDEALALLPDPDNLGAGAAALQVVQTLAGTVPLLFLAAFVLHWMARLSGSEPSVRESMAVYWAASAPAAVGALVRAALVRTQDTVEVSLSPAAFFPAVEFGSLPALVLEIFDLFAVLMLLLLVTGVRTVFGTSPAGAWVLGGGFWALSSLVRFATMVGFSWFAGAL